MKLKKGFDLQEICGMYVVVATGMENIDFSKIINLNETAATIWNAVVGKDFQIDDMADALTANYEVDAETAYKDAKATLEEWMTIGLVEA